MVSAGAEAPQSQDGVTNPNGIGLFRMVTTVITLIVGAGVFSLSGDAAAGGASGWAILTAWGSSAVGVLCLVLTFFALSRVKPDLKGGIYTYAATGFGDFLGFSSAWGYWISALLCTVSFSALLFGALAYFFPLFGRGTDLYAVIAASALIWFYAWLVSRGIKEVSAINAIITISKIVPIFVAIAAIVALGCGFYAGLRMTAPDMARFADEYYDGTALMDIRVVATLGLTDADLEALRGLDEVEAVMGAYETDVMAIIDDEQYAVRVHSLPASAAASVQADAMSVESDDGSYLNRLVLTTDSADPRYHRQIIYLQVKK